MSRKAPRKEAERVKTWVQGDLAQRGPGEADHRNSLAGRGRGKGGCGHAGPPMPTAEPGTCLQAVGVTGGCKQLRSMGSKIENMNWLQVEDEAEGQTRGQEPRQGDGPVQAGTDGGWAGGGRLERSGQTSEIRGGRMDRI